ncbi:MAG: hypothetical protein AAF481_05405 [Acidobacteriota bacterium]
MSSVNPSTESAASSVLLFSRTPAGCSYDGAFERALGKVEGHRAALAAEREEAERTLGNWRRHPAPQRRLLAWNHRGPWTWSLASALVEEAERSFWRDHPQAVALAALAAEAGRRITPERYADSLVCDLRSLGWALHGRALLATGEQNAAEIIERAFEDDPVVRRSPHALHLRSLRLAHQDAAGAGRGFRRAAAAFRQRGEAFYSAIARIDHGLLLTRQVAKRVVRDGQRRGGQSAQQATALLQAGHSRLDRQRAPLAARRAEEALRVLSSIG